MILRGVLLAILVIAAIGVSNAQTPETRPIGPPPPPKNVITSNEAREVRLYGDRFVQRMRETRDLKPLIGEMFVSDFAETFEKEHGWVGLVGLPSPSLEAMNRAERLQCYVDQFTNEYFVALDYNAKIPSAQHEELNYEDVAPEAFRSLANSMEPTASAGKENDPAAIARMLLAVTPKVKQVWQEYFKTHPPEETGIFKDNLAVFAQHLEDEYRESGHPFARERTKDEPGFTPGSKRYFVEIPFHVTLVLLKENGQFKIEAAFTRILPD